MLKREPLQTPSFVQPPVSKPVFGRNLRISPKARSPFKIGAEFATVAMESLHAKCFNAELALLCR